MPSQRWTVSLNNGPRVTLASLFIRGARMEHINQQTSTLSFTMAGNVFTADAPYPEGTTLALFFDQTCRFTGTVTSITTVGLGGEWFWNYVVSNAWYYLERIIYQQPMIYKIVFGGIAFLAWQMFPRVILGQSFWGGALSVSLQVSNILQYANYMGSGGGIFIGSINPNQYFPKQEATNISCAEAIRRCMGWAPNSVISFDYSTGNAAINSQIRSGLSQGTLSLLDPARQIEVQEINPRYDLNVPGVKFIFTVNGVTDISGITYPSYVVQIAGNPGAAGSVFATITLSNPGAVSANVETVPLGLAAAFYASVQGSKWMGRLRVVEEECSGVVRLGQAINISDGRPAWASMNSVVQLISETIDTGETLITFGPPAHLSAGDFADLMQFLRNMMLPQGFSEVLHNSTAGIPADGTPGPLGITSPGPAPYKTPGELTTNPAVGVSPQHAATGVNSTALTSGHIATLALCDGSTQNVIAP